LHDAPAALWRKVREVGHEHRNARDQDSGPDHSWVKSMSMPGSPPRIASHIYMQTGRFLEKIGKSMFIDEAEAEWLPFPLYKVMKMIHNIV
jgi:hypothetical protein